MNKRITLTSRSYDGVWIACWRGSLSYSDCLREIWFQRWLSDEYTDLFSNHNSHMKRDDIYVAFCMKDLFIVTTQPSFLHSIWWCSALNWLKRGEILPSDDWTEYRSKSHFPLKQGLSSYYLLNLYEAQTTIVIKHFPNKIPLILSNVKIITNSEPYIPFPQRWTVCRVCTVWTVF